MRLFIVGLSSVAFIASLVVFTLSFTACETASKDQVDPVLIDVPDVVEPQDTETEEDKSKDVDDNDGVDELDTLSDDDIVQAQQASLSSGVELIVFNVNGTVAYSRVWEQQKQI